MKGNPRINGYVSTTNCRSPSSSDSRNKINRISPGLFNMLKNNISTSNQEVIQTSLNGAYGKSKVGPCVFTECNSSVKNYKENPNVLGIDRSVKSQPTVQSLSIAGHCNIKDTNKKKVKIPLRKKNIRATHHEMLQRIESKLDSFNHYQHHWFSSGLERLKLEPMSREERLEITRYELNRQLNQIVKSEVGADCCIPPRALLPQNDNSNHKCCDDTRSHIGNGIGVGVVKHEGGSISAVNNYHLERKLSRFPLFPPPATSTSATTSCSLLKMGKYENGNTSRSYNIIADGGSKSACLVDECQRLALPSARHCASHITHNTDQVLFTCCTAKFADNTQCSVPVFDIMHELPLCVEHARKRDNYKLNQETKPKKLRKKVKPSAMIRPQKRNKKKKKRSPYASSDRTMLMLKPELLPENPLSEDEELDRALSLQEPVVPDLVELTQEALVTQATHLLEETDISTVLSTIHADEFNDLFSAVNRNGEYEPTREETEELERALAAVDNDVKSLERLSQSHGLLDTFLDEHTLVESLVHIPDVFHHGTGGQNGGFTPGPVGSVTGVSSAGMPSLCSTAAAAAALNASTSRLLPVQHHK